MIYDVAIIGGGPGGVTAGIYVKSWGLTCCIIEKGKIGGQLLQTTEILNYPGFDYITGKELAERMENQIKKAGVEIICGEVSNTKLEGEIKKIYINKRLIESKTVIITSGTSVRTLDIENERALIGKGISYSATNDKAKFQNKTVAVIGGGNSALEDALNLSTACTKVYLIHRRTEFRGDASLVNRVKNAANIELKTPYVPIKFLDIGQLSRMVLKHAETGELSELKIDGAFISIGRDSCNDFVDSKVVRNEQGFIKGDDKMQTNIPGVFVAGDARNTYLRQIVCATSDGALAGLTALNYIRIHNKKG